MKYILLFLISFSFTIKAQNYNENTKYIAGTFHTKNTTINGISFGAFPNENDENRFVKNNGLRLEIPGIGILAPIGNGSPIYNTDINDIDEIINGINISGGTVGKVKFNGFTLGIIAQFGVINNGIAVAGIWNAMNESNGLQASFLLNETIENNGLQISSINTTEKMNGIQIGIFNRSKKTRGIQIGLWNINEKRKLPIINWNFK